MTQLQDQSSAYLLAHNDDEVRWHPWNAEALALAKKKNRPILLSIGYSSSHQCKVMTRESFNRSQIAKLMNNQYVNILVDREERPDLDRLYQAAHRLLARSGGGWPLTAFIDPNDLLPFYSGTYFPPQANENAPAFRDVLNRMATTYESQFEKIEEFKPKLLDAIRKAVGGGEPGEIDLSLIERACGQIDSSFDEKYGGFSSGTKFQHPAGLEFLRDAMLFISDHEKSARAQYMLDFTLANSSLGGVHDHVGGGLFGYAVDNEWSIPHFEKTLCDNAQLISIFAARAAELNNPWFTHVANRAADWLLTDLQLDSGAFASSIDAESNELEGRYYIWPKDELKGVLGADYPRFAETYGLDKTANFKGKWHLRRAAVSSLDDLPSGDAISQILPLHEKLKTARQSRHAPNKDLTVLTAWNGLAIKSLLDVARYLGREDCKIAAFKTIDFIKQHHWQENILVASSRNGKILRPGYLDDYAFVLNALMNIDIEDQRPTDLEFATQVADVMIDQFQDEKNGGFYLVSQGAESPLQRLKIFADDWFPAGNGVACLALFELAERSGNNHYREVAERTLKAAMGDTQHWPSAQSTIVRALIKYATYQS